MKPHFNLFNLDNIYNKKYLLLIPNINYKWFFVHHLFK